MPKTKRQAPEYKKNLSAANIIKNMPFFAMITLISIAFKTVN